VITSVVITGCAGPVALPAPSPAPSARRTCDALVAALPATVLDQDRRDTTAALTAAWGDPPITVSCGVAAPPGMTATAQCFEVDGVGWYAEEGTGGFLFSTIGRSVVIEVGVPTAYAPEANALVDLAGAITATVPQTRPCV